MVIAGLSCRAQDDDYLTLRYTPEEIHLKGSVTKDPEKLVHALTDNKEGEKEKFDALFAWVAANIRYNYRTYYSSNPNSKTNVLNVLKYKSGICMDYANLMDTLCALANITNVSVYGYAKDDIFDVNDSLYLDNHAWNAVKLDKLWYVYDVTWASGAIQYKLTRFSRFMLRLIDKIPSYEHKVVFKNKFHNRNRKVCAPEYFTRSKAELVVTERLYRIPKVRRALQGVKLKSKPVYGNTIDSTWYLCEPNLFAVTHFPNNPIWSLVPNNGIAGFEGDSAFYHLEPEQFATQKRNGVTCEACDIDVSRDDLARHLNTRTQSILFNPKNRFITSYCEFSVANIKFVGSNDALDSLAKVNQLDTAMAWYQLTKESLKASAGNVNRDFNLQKAKNNKKKSILLQDNVANKKFIKDISSRSEKKKKELLALAKKRRAAANACSKRMDDLLKYKTDISVNKLAKADDPIVKENEHKLNRVKGEIDSLNNVIYDKRVLFETSAPLLSDNVWKKVNEYDSLTLPFHNRIFYRYFVKDDYKKMVVQATDRIHTFESNYSAELDSVVYGLGKQLIDANMLVFKRMNERNKKEKECFQLMSKLAKANKLTAEDVKDYKHELLEENLDDICWIQSENSNLLFGYAGFLNLAYRQKLIHQIISYENKLEKWRYQYINAELKRRNTKYKNIVTVNKALVNHNIKNLKKVKKTYLKALKDDRKVKK